MLNCAENGHETKNVSIHLSSNFSIFGHQKTEIFSVRWLCPQTLLGQKSLAWMGLYKRFGYTRGINCNSIVVFRDKNNSPKNLMTKVLLISTTGKPAFIMDIFHASWHGFGRGRGSLTETDLCPPPLKPLGTFILWSKESFEAP